MDEELQLAFELSRKTFAEEEERRQSVEQDLMVVVDPAELSRNNKIEEIKRLFNTPTAENINTRLYGTATPGTPMDFAAYAAYQPQSPFAPYSQAYQSPYAVRASPSYPYNLSAGLNLFNNNNNGASTSTALPKVGSSTVFLTSLESNNVKNSLQNADDGKPPVELPSLKIPFRNGDLIDLQLSPRMRSTKSMTIEEFDPLYIKMNTAKVGTEDGNEPQSSSTVAEVSTIQSEAFTLVVDSKPTNPEGPALVEMPKAMKRSKLLSCDDLTPSAELTCDFYEERDLLTRENERLQIGDNASNVFFLSPFADYYTTAAESIKCVVYQDDTWRRDTPEEPRRLEFACDVRSTCEQILVDVLLRLLPQEEICRNGGDIPLKHYALKVYGSDEFLVESVEIGKHPFVGRYLSLGRDVELEVGRRILLQSSDCSKYLDRPMVTSPVVTRDFFETFQDMLRANVGKCLDNPTDRKLRQSVVQSLKMLTTFMNNVQPFDLVSAIDRFCVETSVECLRHSIHCIILAVDRLMRMYCRSVLTDFSMASLPLDDGNDATTVTRPEVEVHDVSLFQDKVLVSVETLHNMPGDWQNKYQAYFVEAHLMYGPKSYGLASSNFASITTKYHISYAFFCFWAEFDVSISSLPRESQICFIVRGIPYAQEGVENAQSQVGGGLAPPPAHISRQEMLTAHRIASASLPLYNHEGYLLQSSILLPLSPMTDDVVHPWGARPLIRNAEQPILVVKCLEYEYQIKFPTKVPASTVYWREFDSLPDEERDNLQLIVDGGVSSHMLSDDDKQLLWSNRNYLGQLPKALPLILASSFAWSTFSLSNIYPLLQGWEPLPPSIAIELLLPHFQDREVRRKAVDYIRCGSSEFLFNLLTQFVEALRYETFENSPLAVFLLEQSTRNRRFAFELYWQLQQRMLETRNSSYLARCHLLQRSLLDLRIPGFRNEIAHQVLFLEKLDQLAREVKDAPDANMNAVLQQELYHLCDECNMTDVRLPIAPGFQCQAIVVSECGYFNSLTKPIKIIVRGRKTNYGVIFKVGDDLRQDAIVLQLVGVMNDLWLKHNLDLRMVLFRCLPTGKRRGLIELVPDCRTLREIQTAPGATGVFKDDVLNAWLLRKNPSEFQYKAALENFRRSSAGWCVATYVLGIGDRHNDNILVTTTGHVFHIDFGKYMGDWQMAAGFKRDRVPFVLTADMAYVINGGSQNTTEHFQRFIDDCCAAFNQLRRNCAMLINIIQFMSCSDIPGMNMDSVGFVENNLMLSLDDIKATAVFTRMIEESLRSKFPRLNFFAHTLAQLKNNPILFSGRPEDMNRLSFISDMCSEKTDSRIASVHVSSYEKWHTPEKIYMYKLLIKRVNENVTSEIYRSFAEFQELHWKLCYRFSSKAIPPLTLTTAIIGRTNVRAVASKRQVDLESVLQRFFSLSDEVAHSDLVYTFFHTLYRDSEPDATRNQEMRADLRSDHFITPPQIHLRLSFNETRAELTVFVGHAKQLPMVGGREQLPDTYVKTYLRQPHAPQIKFWKRKTLIVRSALNPTYNAELCYSLGHKELDEFTQMILEVSIWHAGSAVLKDNFQLCEALIPLKRFTQVPADRRGIRTVEQWHTMQLCFS